MLLQLNKLFTTDGKSNLSRERSKYECGKQMENGEKHFAASFLLSD